MKKYLILVSMLLIFTIFFTGCGTQMNDIISDFLNEMPQEKHMEESIVNSIGLYVDATPSMEGFLGLTKGKFAYSYKKLVNKTKYLNCLDQINNVLASDFDLNQIKVNHYKVDTPLWLGETNVNVLEEAMTNNFYHGGKIEDWIQIDGQDYSMGYDSPCLTRALEHCINNDFSLIITDLYENGAETDGMITAFKNITKLLPDKTIGIIRLQSEFSGKIYDTERNGSYTLYGVPQEEVTQEDVVYRQCYIIVIGSPDKVEMFCYDLQKETNLSNEWMDIAVFYQEELYGLDYRDFNTYHLMSNSILWPGQMITINDNGNMQLYRYCIQNDSYSEILCSYHVSSDSLKNYVKKNGTADKLLLQNQEIEALTLNSLKKYFQVSIWDKKEQEFIISDSYTGFFDISEIYYQEQQDLLYIKFNITNQELPEAIFKIGFQICVDNSQEIICNWADQWSAKNGDDDYSKTKDLNKLLSGAINGMPKVNDCILDAAIYLKCQEEKKFKLSNL